MSSVLSVVGLSWLVLFCLCPFCTPGLDYIFVCALLQSTLHIRVVLSKKLNLHFLFLISSLGYKIKGISSKTCFLNIENFLEEIV